MGSEDIGGGSRGGRSWVARGGRGAAAHPQDELRFPDDFTDAPRARFFHRLLGLTFLVAFVSLGVQVEALIGSRGLLPVAPLMDGLRAQGIEPWRFPTFMWLSSADGALLAGIGAGAGLSILAALGIWPRLMFLALVPLYLSYATACRTFLSFQWDNLLLECGLLAVFLRRDRPSRWAQLLFMLLLYKLYFESGIAKWQSHLGDWQDGSAMTYYYETAPIPTWLAWYAHHLPAWWHHLESWGTLALELILPLLIFGPRAGRRVALVAFTAFQLVNIATANYGFFSYLSLALHVWLLEDVDVHRLRARWERWRGRPVPGQDPASTRASWSGLVGLVVVPLYLALSVVGAQQSFSQLRVKDPVVSWVLERAAPLRLVNTYHLFGHITRERVEPEFQILKEGEWKGLAMRFKPGPVDRPPPFVAPHQPRVDFRLWFYGLSYQRTPEFVTILLSRLCRDPEAVQSLFVEPLPESPRAARVVLYRYAFTTPQERERTGAWWRREEVARGPGTSCR